MEVDVAKGTSRLIKISMDAGRDDAEARKAAFEQFWTLTKKRFFDLDMNGVDWDAVRAKYESFLPSVADSGDLAELLSEMEGELNASHTGSWFRSPAPLSERTASLGLYYDERYPGPGMKVAAVIAGGPFDAADTALRAGDVLRQIDGEDIPDDRRDASHIERAGQSARRRHRRAYPDGSRFYRETRAGDARCAQTANWRCSAGRSASVTKRCAKSCGHLGYVHLAAMDARSYRDAFSGIFGRFGDVDGLVVDIRYNTGGNLHNHLLTLLSGAAYLTFSPPRGGPDQIEPRDRWTKPSVVIMNAASYSDGSIFPHVYRDLKLGPLVGDPVAGTGTATWWAESNLIPGLYYGMPQVPALELGGKRFENDEIAPDIAVASDPTAWDKGRRSAARCGDQGADAEGRAVSGGAIDRRGKILPCRQSSATPKR